MADQNGVYKEVCKYCDEHHIQVSNKSSKLNPDTLKLLDSGSLEKLKQLAIDQYNEMEQLIMAINDVQDELKEKSKS